LGLIEGVGAEDHAAPFRQLQFGNPVFDRLSVFLLSLARDAADVVVRHQDDVPPGDAEVGGDQGPFAADTVPDDLDQDWLAALEDPVDAWMFAGLFYLFLKGRRHHVIGPQEAVPLDAEVDEGGIQRQLHVGDHATVYISTIEARLGGRDLVLVELVVRNDRDAHLFGALGVNEHASCHDVSYSFNRRRRGQIGPARSSHRAHRVA